jgi:hypothetical protein
VFLFKLLVVFRMPEASPASGRILPLSFSVVTALKPVLRNEKQKDFSFREEKRSGVFYMYQQRTLIQLYEKRASVGSEN